MLVQLIESLNSSAYRWNINVGILARANWQNKKIVFLMHEQFSIDKSTYFSSHFSNQIESNQILI